MPKTAPAQTSRAKHFTSNKRAEPQSDKGCKFEPFHIAAIGRGASGLARELRMDRKR